MENIKNVLLINPPMSIDEVPKFVSFGIAYIAQELKRNGYNAEVVDIDACRFSKEAVSDLLRNKNYDIVGIGGLATVYPYLHWLVPEIKRLRPDVRIILGGAVASSLKERCFNKFEIDYEVIGEGEVTIVELLRELNGGRNLSSVKGIGYRDNGNIVYTESRPLMESLDNVPIIDDTIFPMEKLLANSGGILQVHSQRGCPGRCTFCFNCFRVVSNKVRYRPVKNVIEEIKFFKKKYEINLFALTGECITMNKAWILEFCDQILKSGLKIKYRVTSRVDTIDEEILQSLKKSGCVRMSLGLETGSEKIVKIIRKSASVERGREAVRISKKFIPNIEACIILGYIGEDRNTIKETVRFCKQLGIKPQIFYATPFPGTELYKMALERGRIEDEEKYLMDLGTASIVKSACNLTDMPDDEAKTMISRAINDIDRHYFYMDLLTLRLLKSTFLHIRHSGVKSTVAKIMKNLKTVFQNGFRL